ncbi:MAG TPA: helix-turn-helix domain-containing protein [Candidatus Deferrimicrobium sp.]|nr:helix-turn-helix domain-containing protein [Candidatus Deferrimicrobium sp.]
MSNNQIIEELKTFLKNSKLSTYEIKAYITLLSVNNLTAREISKRGRIPTGRIYDVLEELKNKDMIEIQEDRPKIYRAHPPDMVFNNLITYMKHESQKTIDSLYGQAKILEEKIQNSRLMFKEDASRVFWSTAFGTPAVLELYIKKFNELQEELLITGFLNENTLKILPRATKFYKAIYNAIKRGIQVKYLWSFEFDDRPLSDGQKERNLDLFNKLIKSLYNLFNLSVKLDAFETKLIHRKIPTYYDIFDKKRILMKLQNPLQPSQIFVGMNILDPNLAEELRKKFNTVWMFEATNETG